MSDPNVKLNVKYTFDGEVSLLDSLLEAPESDHTEATGDDIESERGCQHTDVTSRVEEPGSQGQGHKVREIPDKAKGCQAYHSFPGS